MSQHAGQLNTNSQKTLIDGLMANSNIKQEKVKNVFVCSIAIKLKFLIEVLTFRTLERIE